MSTISLVPIAVAYLIGSTPTALIASRLRAGVDIRQVGDGNMGAHNVARTVGWWPGVAVAWVDFLKGSLTTAFAMGWTNDLSTAMLAGFAAVLGHDFPLWGGFRGGQGMATILGVLFALLPIQMAGGLAVVGAVYLLTRHFDVSAGLGLGSIALLAGFTAHPGLLYSAYAVVLFLSIAVKKVLDTPRRRRLKTDSQEGRRTARRRPIERRPT